MTPTPKRSGLATVVKAADVICRIVAIWGPHIRAILSGAELAAFNTLALACEEFRALKPIPGTDDDPGTIE